MSKYVEPMKLGYIEEYFNGKETTYIVHETDHQEERKKINELAERINELLLERKIKHGK